MGNSPHPNDIAAGKTRSRSSGIPNAKVGKLSSIAEDGEVTDKPKFWDQYGAGEWD